MLPRRRPRTSVTPLALIAVGGALVLVLVAYVIGILDLLRAALGLVILILPGLALAITSRPGSSLRQLDRFLVAAAISLACVAVGGLILNLLPIGLGRFSWLGLVAALLLTTAILARGELPALPSETWVHPKRGQAIAMGSAILLVAVALAIARVGVKQPTEPFSALWVVPEASGMVQIGLDNREDAATTYRIEVSINGRVTATFSSVRIAVGDGWTTVLSEPNPRGSGMEVLVYRESEPDVVYRHVTFRTGAAPTVAGT